ncbi:MAG TPA: molybdopterin oxidoreductase [Polyangiaceae bacterium]|nr:molybdopterin oxidoreductase [Polyangiaceae bacterium]
MAETPRFIQGVYSFRGAGLANPVVLRPAATHRVPFDKRAQLIYLRAGNASGEMIYVSLNRGERSVRLFPIGARSAIHVQLAIVEDIDPDSTLELRVGAPEGLDGTVVIDMGLVEI